VLAEGSHGCNVVCEKRLAERDLLSTHQDFAISEIKFFLFECRIQYNIGHDRHRLIEFVRL
jgi:hypothetical protein